MFSPSLYADRRRQLAAAVADRDRSDRDRSPGLIVLLGNEDAPMNYRGNVYPFRQDGSFLYYTGLDRPGHALSIDAETGEATLYGHDPTMDDVVWEGEMASLADRAAAAGVERTAPPDALASAVARARAARRTVHTLPAYRGEHTLRLAALLDTAPVAVEPSAVLIDAVIAQRLVKTAGEVAEIERAVEVAAEMHRLAMRLAQPGRTEWEVAGAMEGLALGRGSFPSFPIILSRQGQTLHNHATDARLQAGDLMLADAGAVAPTSRYAADVTRTSPVGGRFSERQRAAYQAVLDTQLVAIDACRPGVPYRDVHTLSARTLVDALKGLGLMRGDTDEAVAAGAHALFYPHGLGHPIGLDVHDMEALGEDRVGYGEGSVRSDQFGTSSLRFARPLAEGYVLTVEPGFYMIGPLIDLWRAEGRHADFLDYDEVDRWRGFGGIRIEDDVLIEADGARVLGPPIPKSPEAVEAEVQSGA